MNIVGPDSLIFGVDDVEACARFLTDYGLVPKDVGANGGRFEATDGTSVVIARRDDPSLPPPMETGTMLRKTVYGVADRATLDAIAVELGRDREVTRLPDGSIESKDDMGFVLGFQLTVRRKIDAPTERVNAPGQPARAANELGASKTAPALPLTLSHVVYFVPDQAKAAQFYIDRLGFRCVDRFTNAGSFLRPAGTIDHHTLFLIHTPPHMKGVEHFTFHVSGPTAVLQAGKRFLEKGYESYWGPGRHLFGSNWFWYFNSPMGCHVEYDADMDLHDDSWVPREAPMQPDYSQIFLFQYREQWAPGRPTAAGTMTSDAEATVLCRLDDLPVHGSRGFDPRGTGRDTLFVVRRRERVQAWVNACPHVDGAPLAWRKDAYLSADRGAIVCYGHGARFDIDSGVCTAGPCLGQSLTAIPVVVDPNGEVRIPAAAHQHPWS